MNISDFRNVEIIKNSISNRGNIVVLPPGKHIYELDYYSKEVINGFNSVFYHQDRVKEFFKDTSDKKPSYDGSVYSNYLIWDFDNKENVGAARLDTIELIERLMAYTPTNISAYFSGGKGFHVVYVCPELDRVKVDTYEHVVKNVCLDLAKGLQSLDTRIYDKMRVIRTPNSRHGSTKLFKVPISYNQLKDMTVDEILKYAESQHQHKITPDMTINEDLLNLIKDNLEVKEVRKAKTSLPELVEGIYNGFRENHNRNDGLTSLCGLLHSRDVPDDIVRALVTITNERNKVPLPESEVNTICNSVSRYRVDDRYVAPTNKDFITFKEAGEIWKQQMNMSGDFSLGERFSHINDVMNVTLLGDLIGIVGNSGTGKSTLCMDFANCLCRERGNYSAFFSLEMASHACFFRGATISYPPDEFGEVSSKKVAYELLHNQSLMESVSKEWERILILDKGSITLEKIEEYANIAKEITNDRLGSIIIDYSQYIEGASDIDKMLEISRNVKAVLKRLKVIGFMAMQCNKLMPNSYTEIEDTHIEGSKSWKQVCDYILAFWKSRDDTKRLHGKFLKTRWEKDDVRFDMVRDGLKYHTEVYKPDVNNGIGGL